jgi:hypothetical protein
MGSPLDSSQFVRLLDKRLREVAEGEYKDLPSMIPTLFRMLSSDSAWEEFYSVGAVPDIPEFNGKLSMLGIAPGYYFKIEPKEWAAGINAERKLIDDKKYGVLDGRAKGLIQAAHRTREKQGVRAFNLMFSAAFDYMQSEEGLSLSNTGHLTKSGTSTASGFSNAGTTKFSKTAVAATRLAMRLFRNDISERIEISDNLALIVPDALADDAYELVKTPKGYGSAESNVNMAYQRYEIIPYMRLDDNSTTNWSMVDRQRMKQNLMWIDRISPETKATVDYDTYMLRQAVYFRCGYGWIDWRWIFGHNVA